jgi:hypothetical protein
MTSPELPYEVRALLQRALPSMVHVEALLLLAKSPSESFQPHAVAAKIGGTPDVVAAALAELATARLVEQTPGSAPAEFRLAATDVSTANAVSSLQEMYDRRPVTLVKAVYDRPPSAVKAFADAFRVRPKGEG